MTCPGKPFSYTRLGLREVACTWPRAEAGVRPRPESTGKAGRRPPHRLRALGAGWAPRHWGCVHSPVSVPRAPLGWLCSRQLAS